MYWEKELETMDRKSLEALQGERLRKTLFQAARSYHYDRRFKEMALDLEKIRSVEDLRRLPLTTKDDLREHWPYVSWRRPGTTWSGCTPPRVQLDGPRSSSTPRAISMHGQTSWPGPCI